MLISEACEFDVCFYCGGSKTETSDSGDDRECLSCDGHGDWLSVVYVISISHRNSRIAAERYKKRELEADWTECRFCDGVGFFKSAGSDGHDSFDDCAVCQGEHIVPPTSVGWDPQRKPWWSDITHDGMHVKLPSGELRARPPGRSLGLTVQSSMTT